jgi:RNA polymerase sigma factor (sigma-70 family)
MDERDWLAERFEENRGHLRGVAYRMLGSLPEAEDAVQESWLRLSRSGGEGIENLGGWLTTVVARVCLDMLRSRNAKREEPLEIAAGGDSAVRPSASSDPENEALMADSVGLALLVVLERLEPAERLAFVLHDLFDLPFEEIAGIVGRSAGAARQLASRARRRVRGSAAAEETVSRQRRVVDAFLRALRAGDVQGLVAVMDPDFVARSYVAATPDVTPETHGAENFAKQAVQAAKGARFARLALVDGNVGVVVAPKGRLVRVLRFTFAGEKIAGMEVVGDPEELKALDLAVLD